MLYQNKSLHSFVNAEIKRLANGGHASKFYESFSKFKSKEKNNGKAQVRPKSSYKVPQKPEVSSTSLDIDRSSNAYYDVFTDYQGKKIAVAKIIETHSLHCGRRSLPSRSEPDHGPQEPPMFYNSVLQEKIQSQFREAQSKSKIKKGLLRFNLRKYESKVIIAPKEKGGENEKRKVKKETRPLYRYSLKQNSLIRQTLR